MANQDPLPQVNYNDGEGIDEDDFNRAQSLSDAKLYERSSRIGSLAAVHSMGFTTGRGGDMSQQHPRPESILDASAIYTPDPRTFVNSTFEITGAGNLAIDFGPQLFLQRSSASTPGTAPQGFDESSLGAVLAFVSDVSDEISYALKARPTTNPRFDSINIRLGHDAGNAVSRDFEDSSTRALSSTSPSKDQLRIRQHEYQEGAESATPVYPSPTSGYGRFITVKRETGETSLNQDNVGYHAFPMKLKVETIYGHQGWAPTGFQENNARVGAIEKNGAGGGSVVFQSRQMHEGCRLVGIGISTQNFGFNLDEVMIQRTEGSAAGVISQIDILNVGGGSPLSTSVDGFAFVGLPELDDADGNDTPIWGNGRSYGPLFSDKAQNPAEGMMADGLALTLLDIADWAGGELINYVQFYYLE